MTISTKTRKVLWTRAHDSCAFPGCLQALTVDSIDATTAESTITVLGEEAHIRSARVGGPRHDPQYPHDKLDSYENLILLCPNHHSLIDANNGAGHKVEVLLDMRSRHERQQSRRTELEHALHAYLVDQYDADDKVYFQQVDLHGPSVDSMFVDVPFACRENSPSADFIRQIAQQYPGDAEANEGAAGFIVTGAALALLHPEWTGNAILLGGPGQGKSTLLQYVCQFHRARRLGKNTYSAEDSELVRSKSKRRFPIRIDLRKYAQWANTAAPGNGKKRQRARRQDGRDSTWPSIEQYIAGEVKRHSGGHDFGIKDLSVLVQTEPVLIALDGLDEVANLRHRELVTAEILRTQARLGDDAADLVVLVASRPGGTLAKLTSSSVFPAFYLRRLSQGLRLQYLQQWAKVAGLTVDATQKLQGTFMDNQHVPHIRELASYPMQLAILLHLLYQRQLLPQQRTDLYQEYLKTFLDREQTEDKEPLLAEDRQVIEDIHAFLGWHLQTKAEQGLSDGSIEREELRQLVHDHLAGRAGGQQLAEKLFSAISTRVLCLVERDSGRFQFEVQSLREYFAAVYVFENAPIKGVGNTRDDCLDALLERPYWANVCRFFVGMFSKVEVRGIHENFRQVNRSVRPHPMIRSMAALLLDDRTYDGQADGPIQEVVDFVLEGSGVVLAEDGLLDTAGSALRLTERAGRAQAVAHLKERFAIEADPRLQQIIASSLQRHAIGDDGLINWWWQQFAATRGWLATAATLQVLGALSPERTDQLAQAVRAARSEHEWVTPLLLSGGYDGGSDTVLEVVRDELNEGVAAALTQPLTRSSVSRIVAAAETAEHPSLRSNEHLAASQQGQRTRIRRRDQGALLTSLTASQPAPPMDADSWLARLRTIGRTWGDGWVLRRATAAIPQSIDAAAIALRLGDQDAPISAALNLEAGYRANRGDADWWSGELTRASTGWQQRIWALALLSNAHGRVVVALSDQLDEVVATMTPMQFAGVEATLANVPRATSTKDLAIQEGLRLGLIRVSARTLWLLRLVATSAAVERIDRQLAERRPEILQAGLGDIRAALAASRSAKTLKLDDLRGLRGSLPPGSVATGVKLGAMTAKTATDVLTTPADWPADVVRQAADHVAARLASKAVPLGTLATSNNWFRQ